MNVRLTSLEVENFRGFRDSISFDLDADIVLLRGDNGSGKTSFADSFLWLLSGDLPHLKSRMRGTRRAHDHILSRYATGPARVSLDIKRDGRTYRIQRTGDARSSQLVVTDTTSGAQPSNLAAAFAADSAEDLITSFETWGVLRQDAVRLVLDTAGSALHERLSSVVGLSDLTMFREACRTSLKLELDKQKGRASALAVATNALDEATLRVDDARSNRASRIRSSLGERLSVIGALSTQPLVYETSSVHGESDLVSFGQDVSSIAELALSASSAFEGLSAARRGHSADPASVRQELDSIRAEVDALRESTDLQRQLATSALKLLGEHCPVCEQEIDAAEVRARLERSLTEGANGDLVAARTSIMLGQLEQRLRDAIANEEATLRATRALERAEEELFTAIDQSLYVSVMPEMRSALQLGALQGDLEQARLTLRHIYAELQAETLGDEAILQAALEATRAQVDRAKAESLKSSERVHTARRLDKAAQAAIEQIVASLLHRLEPSFAEVFDRLSPHPTFSRLRAKQDVFYNKNQIVPEVVDVERGKTANPLLVFSEGQLNTVALSYFLGLALNSNTPGLDFMLLDDPLQAMDVLAVLGFADLCRRLRQQRQLFITTHDRRYADLLARKLAPREDAQATTIHVLSGWTERGPNLVTQREFFGASLSVLRSVAS